MNKTLIARLFGLLTLGAGAAGYLYHYLTYSEYKSYGKGKIKFTDKEIEAIKKAKEDEKNDKWRKSTDCIKTGRKCCKTSCRIREGATISDE